MRNIALVLSLAASAAAQSPSDPPPLLQLTRIPHGNRTERPYLSAKAAVDVIGLASITGMPETWLIEAHQTFASIEDLDTALRGHAAAAPANQFGEPQSDELLGAPRTIVAAYMPGFSYRPSEAARNLPKARYFRVSIYRLKPGSSDIMDTLHTQRRQEYNAVNLDRSELAYRVISGAPASTYLVLSPLASLRQIDDGMLRLPSYMEPMAETTAAGEIGREHLLFRIDPRLSYVSAAFAGEDSEFWKPQRQ
jgi:hypothetical protein